MYRGHHKRIPPLQLSVAEAENPEAEHQGGRVPTPVLLEFGAGTVEFSTVGLDDQPLTDDEVDPANTDNADLLDGLDSAVQEIEPQQ